MFVLSDRLRVYKNLIAFTSSFFLLYTACSNIQSIQTILNSVQGLGHASQLVTFSFQFLFCLTFPQIITKKLGFKWSMVFCEFCLTAYVAANAYPQWYTLIPASIINGVGQAVLWTFSGLYISLLAAQYSKLTNADFQNVSAKFFGIFSAIFSSVYSLGSLLMALILQTEEHVPPKTFLVDQVCGAFHCPYKSLPLSTTKPTDMSTYTLFGVFVFICIISIVITILFMDNISTIPTTHSSASLRTSITITTTTTEPEIILAPGSPPQLEIEVKNNFFMEIWLQFKKEIKSLLNLCKSIDLWLLFPIMFYAGFEITYIWNEFNRSIVSCTHNINQVGWTNICFGVTCSVFSLIFGLITKYVTRTMIIVFILMLSFTNYIFVLTWIPRLNDYFVVFSLSISLAVSCSYTHQIRAMFHIEFPHNQSAHSAASLFQTFGFIIGFLCSLFLCTSQKTYVSIGLIFISLVSYVIFFCRNRIKLEQNDNEQKKQQRQDSIVIEAYNKPTDTPLTQFSEVSEYASGDFCSKKSNSTD